MEPAVLEELKIVRSELRKAGADVPLEELKQWSIRDRAYAEQWALGAEGVEMPDVVRPFVRAATPTSPLLQDQKSSN